MATVQEMLKKRKKGELTINRFTGPNRVRNIKLKGLKKIKHSAGI